MEFGRLIRRGWILIVMTILLALTTSFVITRTLPRIYRADTTLLINQFFLKANPGAADLHAGEQLAKTYAALATKEAVLVSVAKALRSEVAWRELVHHIVAVPIAGTQLLRISATGSSPGQARMIADETARQLIQFEPVGERNSKIVPEFISQEMRSLEAEIGTARERLIRIEGDTLSDDSSMDERRELQARVDRLRDDYVKLLGLLQRGSSTRFSVVEKASGPAAPVDPIMWRNLFLSGLAGFLIALVGLILSDLFRSRRMQ